MPPLVVTGVADRDPGAQATKEAGEADRALEEETAEGCAGMLGGTKLPPLAPSDLLLLLLGPGDGARLPGDGARPAGDGALATKLGDGVWAKAGEAI